MISSKLLSATAIALVGIFPLICTGGFSTQAKSSQRSNVIRGAVRQGKFDLSSATRDARAQLPGLSEMRVTYKLNRSDIHESNVGVTQSIDDHWCVDFNLPAVPLGCSCWRYEYLAYFCVDWSCVNGHTSDFAMCQFLNVTWPLDPPRRHSSNQTNLLASMQPILKILASYLPPRKQKDASLALKLLSLGQNLQQRGVKN